MENKKGNFDDDQYSDPSFVCARFSRRQCAPGVSLFRSDIKHQNVIALEIDESVLSRSHGDQHTIPGKRLIEVTFSPTQFAELLTTMNIGEGVAGTLNYYNGENYSLPEIPPRSEQFKSEIKNQLNSVLGGLMESQKKAEELLTQSKPLNKAEKEELLFAIEKTTQLLKSNLPFIMDQFAKSMNKVTTEAKATVEAFVTNAAIKTGMESLKLNCPQISEDSN